jgi:hypothetical protein
LALLRAKLKHAPFAAAAADIAETESAPAEKTWFDVAKRPGELWAKWLVTRDRRLIAAATRAVEAAERFTEIAPQIHLHEGMVAGSLALAYDAFYPHLSRGDRGAWQTLLLRLLRLYLKTAHGRSWTVTTNANANPVGNGGCGLAALALWREYPALAERCLEYARRNIRRWRNYCQGPDGGNTEGVQYWQYGMENLLRFALALERVTGRDDGLLSHPSIRNAMNMVRVSLCNDGALHGVNDTVPMPIGGAIGWFVAGRFGDAFGLWYGDHAQRWCAERRAAGKPIAYAPGVAEMLLYRPGVAESSAAQALPLAFKLDSIQYGIIRSGQNFDCRWTAGLKGSRPPYTHHNQPDTGSLFIDLRGERLIIDPGYFKPAPTDHSLALIGGKGPVQPRGRTGSITACAVGGRLRGGEVGVALRRDACPRDGARGPPSSYCRVTEALPCTERTGLRYLAVDATAAYANAARVVRHIVLVGEDGLVLLDDIVACERVTAQYQCGGATSALEGGRSLVVAGNQARLRMDLLTRTDAVFALKPERSLHDTHWGYHFADCRMFPVTAEYTAEEMDPLVTVFGDATSDAASRCTLARGERDLALRFVSGQSVRFVYLGGRWRLDI